MSKKYKDICVNILKEKGPLLGSELRKHLIEKTEIKYDYARTIIHRLKTNKDILSSEPVKFFLKTLLSLPIRIKGNSLEFIIS